MRKRESGAVAVKKRSDEGVVGWWVRVTETLHTFRSDRWDGNSMTKKNFSKVYRINSIVCSEYKPVYARAKECRKRIKAIVIRVGKTIVD